MKRTGRELRFLEDCREWEKSNLLCVFGTDGVAPDGIDRTVGRISAVIVEFNLPLRALNGNVDKAGDVDAVKDLIRETANGGVIDFDRAFGRLRESTIPYGVVVLVNRTYRLKEPLAQYGQANDEGLIVLVGWDIGSAVRHEFGHMIGLNHHEGCAMAWECDVDEFCENCKTDIREIWEL